MCRYFKENFRVEIKTYLRAVIAFLVFYGMFSKNLHKTAFRVNFCGFNHEDHMNLFNFYSFLPQNTSTLSV